jgi:hypothetical protein
MRIRIHEGTFEDKVLKINIRQKYLLFVLCISYLLAIKMYKKLGKNAFFLLFFAHGSGFRIQIHKVIEYGSNPDPDPQP